MYKNLNLGLTDAPPAAPYGDMNLGNVSKALSIAGFEQGNPNAELNLPAQPQGGGFMSKLGQMGGVADAVGNMAQSGGPDSTPGYTTQEEQGAKNQAAAANLLGTAIGAIASFYSGNVGGMAGAAGGLAGKK